MTTVTHLASERTCSYCRLPLNEESVEYLDYNPFRPRQHMSFHDECYVEGTWMAKYEMLEDTLRWLPFRGQTTKAASRLGLHLGPAIGYGVEFFVAADDELTGLVHVPDTMIDYAITDLVLPGSHLSFQPIFDPPWNTGVTDLVALVIGPISGTVLKTVREITARPYGCVGCGGGVGIQPSYIDYGFIGRGLVHPGECHLRVREWAWMDLQKTWRLTPRMSSGFCVHTLGESWSDHRVDQHLRECRLLGHGVGASIDHLRNWRVLPGSPWEAHCGAGAMISTSEPYDDHTQIDLSAFQAEQVAVQIHRYDSLPLHNPATADLHSVLFLWGGQRSENAEPTLRRS